ncbi:MAG: hypothetical protein DMG27_09545 [Acidobacteria bacterium]|nr:MAG: hypothetical protein DMG27_09545 [Acidobacteriota bacterium]
MLFLWVRYLFVIRWALGEDLMKLNAMERDTVVMLLGIDAIIFLYLLTYPVRRAFDKQSKSVTRGPSARVPAAGRILLDEAYEHALSEYGNKGYEFCKGLMERSPITLPHPRDPNKQVEITAFWDDVSEQREGGPIQVQVCVPYSTPHGVEPPTRSFVVYADVRVVPSEPD